MTVTSGFFNSVNHDRKYNAEEISSIFDGIILDGVYQGFGEALKVSGTSVANQVKIGSGRAWFNHTWTLNDEALYLTLPAANSTYPRIDAIILEVNNSSSVRANTIKYISGAAASSPTKPTLTNTTEVHQYPLAYITRPKASTTISAGNIENAIGTSACPIVTGVLEVLDDDLFIAQTIANLTTDFNTWFDGIKGILDGDAATSLANKILEVETQVKINTKRIKALDSLITVINVGKNLGSTITEDQFRSINNGTDEFNIGDYWEINGTKYVIAGRDTFINENAGIEYDTNNKHHLIIVPLKAYAIGTKKLKCMPFDSGTTNKEPKYKNFIAFCVTDSSYLYGGKRIIPCMEDYIYMDNVLSSIYNDIPKNKLKRFPMLVNDGITNVKYESFTAYPIQLPTVASSLYANKKWMNVSGSGNTKRGLIFLDLLDSGLHLDTELVYVGTRYFDSFENVLEDVLINRWQKLYYNYYNDNKYYVFKRIATLLSSQSDSIFGSSNIIDYDKYNRSKAFNSVFSVGNAYEDLMPSNNDINKMQVSGGFTVKKKYTLPENKYYPINRKPTSTMLINMAPGIKFYSDLNIYGPTSSSASGNISTSWLTDETLASDVTLYNGDNVIQSSGFSYSDAKDKPPTNNNAPYAVTSIEQTLSVGSYTIPFIVI